MILKVYSHFESILCAVIECKWFSGVCRAAIAVAG